MLYVVVFVVSGNVRKVYTYSAAAADELLEILSRCDKVETVYINC